LLVPVWYLGARLYYHWRGRLVGWKKAEDLDFVTDISEIEAETFDDPPPKNKLEAFWAWLM